MSSNLFAEQSNNPKHNILIFPGSSKTYKFEHDKILLSPIEYINNDTLGASQNVVKKVLHVPTGNFMAVKIVDIVKTKKLKAISQQNDNNKKVEKILHEFKVLKSVNLLGQDLVVNVFGLCFSKKPDRVCLFMELMIFNLRDLKDLVHRVSGKFSEMFLCPIGKALVEICMFLQNVQVLHCDIKPENIFLTEKGKLKFGDFGEAYFTSEKTDGIKGTPIYMAPELFKGRARARKGP